MFAQLKFICIFDLSNTVTPITEKFSRFYKYALCACGCNFLFGFTVFDDPTQSKGIFFVKTLNII